MVRRLVLGGLILLTLGGGNVTRVSAETLPVFNVGFVGSLTYRRAPIALQDVVRVYVPVYNSGPEDVLVTADCSTASQVTESMSVPVAQGRIVHAWCDIVMRSSTERVTAHITSAAESVVGVGNQSIQVIYPSSPELLLRLASVIDLVPTSTSTMAGQLPTTPIQGPVLSNGTGGVSDSLSITTTPSSSVPTPSQSVSTTPGIGILGGVAAGAGASDLGNQHQSSGAATSTTSTIFDVVVPSSSDGGVMPFPTTSVASSAFASTTENFSTSSSSSSSTSEVGGLAVSSSSLPFDTATSSTSSTIGLGGVDGGVGGVLTSDPVTTTSSPSVEVNSLPLGSAVSSTPTSSTPIEGSLGGGSTGSVLDQQVPPNGVGTSTTLFSSTTESGQTQPSSTVPTSSVVDAVSSTPPVTENTTSPINGQNTSTLPSTALPDVGVTSSTATVTTALGEPSSTTVPVSVDSSTSTSTTNSTLDPSTSSTVGVGSLSGLEGGIGAGTSTPSSSVGLPIVENTVPTSTVPALDMATTTPTPTTSDAFVSTSESTSPSPQVTSSIFDNTVPITTLPNQGADTPSSTVVIGAVDGGTTGVLLPPADNASSLSSGVTVPATSTLPEIVTSSVSPGADASTATSTTSSDVSSTPGTLSQNGAVGGGQSGVGTENQGQISTLPSSTIPAVTMSLPIVSSTQSSVVVSSTPTATTILSDVDVEILGASSSVPTSTTTSGSPSPSSNTTSTTNSSTSMSSQSLSSTLLTPTPTSTISSFGALEGMQNGVVDALTQTPVVTSSTSSLVTTNTPSVGGSSGVSSNITSTVSSTTVGGSTSTVSSAPPSPSTVSSTTVVVQPQSSVLGGIIAASSGGAGSVVMMPVSSGVSEIYKPTVSSTAAALVNALVDSAVSALPTPQSLMQKVWNTSTLETVVAKVAVPTSTVERLTPDPSSTVGKVLATTERIITSLNHVVLPYVAQTEQRLTAVADQEKTPVSMPLLVRAAEQFDSQQNLVEIPHDRIPSVARLKSLLAKAAVRVLSTWWLMLWIYLLILYLLYRLWRVVKNREYEPVEHDEAHHDNAHTKKHSAPHGNPLPSTHGGSKHHH